ncbi:LysR family transcriptional regulator [Aurantiacibacter xanthus]|uniref:LysR family transcriptional regulator n=1 Tax=Aurantiacibacter xanthus TaxID=1784712 RepID=A0A3A1P3Z7_9SPHN|nr:LysR family transcriptional regulator [Aurantiacibacter xanthus]RIV80142.1 LysR family transcriptional regulator [Aurantiacibacter xanthus]
MDLKLLRHFQVVAYELHFGRAARRLDILPSALGRNIRLLEEEIGTRLFVRSTRNVALTKSGIALQHEVDKVLTTVDDAIETVLEASRTEERVFRIGAIDSAATGLIPQLMHDFRNVIPDLELVLVEDKTARLLPKMMNGALDVAFVRPPMSPRPQIHFEHLLDEPTEVALPPAHPLVERDALTVQDLAGIPLIVPSPRNRPHSYNMTMRLFRDAGLEPTIAQQAEEKQTIVNLVGAGIGAALVPHWTSRIGVEGVVYRPLVDAEGRSISQLPLAAAWVQGSRDANRERLVELVKANLDRYSR